MSSLLPPRWKDLESDERYAQLAPSQRLGVFNKWLTDASAYGTDNGWWDNEETTSGFKNLVKTKLSQLSQEAFEEQKVGGFEDVKDATGRAGYGLLGTVPRFNVAFTDALLGISKAIDYVPGLVADGLNKTFNTDLKVDSWLTNQLRNLSQSYQASVDAVEESSQKLDGGELGDLAGQFATAGSDAVVDVSMALATGGRSVPSALNRRAPGLFRGVLDDLTENFMGPAGRQLRIASTLGSGRSYSGTWNDAIAQYTDLGFSREEAEAKAMPEALNAGAATYLITMLGGKTGVESVLKNSGAQGLRGRVKEVLVEMTSEGLEEGADQSLQDLNERFVRNPDKAVSESLKEIKYAVGLGSLLGGGFSAVGQTVEQLRESGAPQTAEAVARGWWETPEATAQKLTEVKKQLDADFGTDDDLDVINDQIDQLDPTTSEDDAKTDGAASNNTPTTLAANDSQGPKLDTTLSLLPASTPASTASNAANRPSEAPVNILPTGNDAILPPQQTGVQQPPDDTAAALEADKSVGDTTNIPPQSAGGPLALTKTAEPAAQQPAQAPVNTLPTGTDAILPPQRMGVQQLPDDTTTSPEIDRSADVFANVRRRVAPTNTPKQDAVVPELRPEAQAYEASLVEEARRTGVNVTGRTSLQIKEDIRGKGWYTGNINKAVKEIKERVRQQLVAVDQDAPTAKQRVASAETAFLEPAETLIEESRRKGEIPSSATINTRFTDTPVEQRRAIRREAVRRLASDYGIEFGEDIDFTQDFDGRTALPIRVSETETAPVFVNNADVTARQLDAGFVPVVPESLRNSLAEGIEIDPETGRVTSSISRGVVVTFPGQLESAVKAQRPGGTTDALTTEEDTERAAAAAKKFKQADIEEYLSVERQLMNMRPRSEQIEAAFGKSDLVAKALSLWSENRIKDRQRAKSSRKNYTARQVWEFTMDKAGQRLKRMPKQESLDAPIGEDGTATRGDRVAAQDRAVDAENSMIEAARDAAIDEANSIEEGVALDEPAGGDAVSSRSSGTGMTYSQAYSIINSPRVLEGVPQDEARLLREEAQQLLAEAEPLIETLEADDVDYWDFKSEDFSNVNNGNPGTIVSSSRRAKSPYISEQVSWMEGVARALGARRANALTPEQHGILATYFSEKYRPWFEAGNTTLPVDAVGQDLTEIRERVEARDGAASVYRDVIARLSQEFPGAKVRFSTAHNASAWFNPRYPDSIFFNPLLLEQELEGLTDSEATPFLRQVMFEEYLHMVERQTIPYEWVVAIAQRMDSKVRQRVLDEYVAEDLFDDPAERQRVIDSLDDHSIGSEYLRMLIQRMRTGQTTEDLAPEKLPKDILERIYEMLRALVSRLRAKLEVARDPVLAHTIRAIEGGMRKLDILTELQELSAEDIDQIKADPASARFIFARPKGSFRTEVRQAPNYQEEAARIAPGRSYWINPDGRVVDVVAEDTDGTSATHGRYIRNWVNARVGRFFPGEYEKEQARKIEIRARELMAEDPSLREELDQEAIEDAYQEEVNLAEALGDPIPDRDDFVNDAVRKLGPSDLAYNEAAIDAGWARIAVPSKFSSEAPFQVQTRKGQVSPQAQKTIKELQGMRKITLVEDGAISNKAVNRTDIGAMMLYIRSLPDLRYARPRGKVDQGVISAIIDSYARSPELSEAAKIAKRGDRPIYPPEEGQFVSLQEGTQRYRHNLQVRRNQAAALTKWAESNGLLLDNAEFERRWQQHRANALQQDPTLDPDEVANGVEHDVYFDEVSQRWFKRAKGMTVTAPSMFVSYDQYLDRLAAHSAIFPDTAPRFEGFVEYEFEEGGQLQRELAPVISQADIVAERGATKEETVKYMEARGFKMRRPNDKRNGHKNWVNGEGVIVEDLHDENIVVTPEGEIKVIDPVIYLPDSFKIQAARPGNRVRGRAVGAPVRGKGGIWQNIKSIVTGDLTSTKTKTGGWFSSGKLTPIERDIIQKSRQKISADAAAAEFAIEELRRAVKSAFSDGKVPSEVINRALGSTENPLTDQQVNDLKKIRDKEAREAKKAEFRSLNRDAARADRQTALAELPPPVAKAVERMRSKIDELSRRMIKDGYIPDTLVPVFDENLDIYLHREYLIFQNPDWKDNILAPKTEEQQRIRTAAERLFTNRAIAEEAVRLRRIAKEQGAPISKEESIKRAKTDTAVIEGRASDLLLEYLSVADENSRMFFMGANPPGKRDMSIIKVRGQIPKEVRALWGEISDAETNFAQTVAKMSAFMAKHDVATELLQHGIENGYIWKRDYDNRSVFNGETRKWDVILAGRRQQGFNTKEEAEKWRLAEYPKVREQLQASAQPAGYVHLIPKGIANVQSITPLNDAYGPSELRDALQQMHSLRESSGFARSVSFLTAMFMAMKTIGYFPQAYVRNFLSNPFGQLISGGINVQNWGSMTAALREGYRVAKLNSGLRGRMKGVEDTQQLREKLLRLGVLADNPKGSMLKDLYEKGIESAAMQELLERKDFKTFGEKISVKALQGANTTFNKMADIYQGIDDLWKAYGWSMEVQNQRRAHPDWTEEQVEQKAAENIRDMVWTYSMSPEVTKRLRRVPVLAPFITWTSEVLRATSNAVAIANEEIRVGKQTGNKAMYRNGINRRAGQFAAFAALPSLAMAMRYILGYDEDDEEALRTMLPEWQQNAQIVLLGEGEGGKQLYVDLSYLDPLQVFKEPAIAIIRSIRGGDNPFDVAVKGFKETLKPVFSEQLFAGAMFDLARNRTAQGRNIWNPADTAANKTQAMLWHVVEKGGPGMVVGTAPRIYKAATGQVSPSGRSFNLGAEIAAPVTGQRISEVDAQTSLRQAVSRFKTQDADSTSLLSNYMTSRGSVDPDDIAGAYDNANRAKREAFEELSKVYNAALRLGTPESVARQTLLGAGKDLGLSREDVAMLVSGEYRNWRPSRRMMELALTREGGRERINSLMSHLREVNEQQWD
jgi:hypothetical protein